MKAVSSLNELRGNANPIPLLPNRAFNEVTGIQRFTDGPQIPILPFELKGRRATDDPEICDLKVIVVTAKDLTETDRARLDSLVTQVLQKGGLRREDLLGSVRRSVAHAAGDQAGDQG